MIFPPSPFRSFNLGGYPIKFNILNIFIYNALTRSIVKKHKDSILVLFTINNIKNKKLIL